MTIQSMTGFARCEGRSDTAAWYWEVRSVNNRGLDVRLKLPAGHDGLEPRCREAVARRFQRGSVNASLNVTSLAPSAMLRVNEQALGEVLAAARRIGGHSGIEPARADGILALKGVIETVEAQESEDAQAARHGAILASLETALGDLGAARHAEGLRLKSVLEQQVDEIERRVAAVASSPSRTPEAIATRIADLIAKLTAGTHALDPLRLHQEAVLIATRADVEEELKRLQVHAGAVRALLSEAGAVGRKLDFLAQELNREANTLTSKSSDADIARHGLALKVVIDQMREQVQNIE